MTTVIRGGRGTGKTTMLIRYSVETQTPILVANHIRADHLKLLARKLGIENMPEPICVRGILDPIKRMGLFPRDRDILVDDVEDVFKTAFGNLNIKMVTYTPGDEFDLDLVIEKLSSAHLNNWPMYTSSTTKEE